MLHRTRVLYYPRTSRIRFCGIPHGRKGLGFCGTIHGRKARVMEPSRVDDTKHEFFTFDATNPEPIRPWMVPKNENCASKSDSCTVWMVPQNPSPDRPWLMPQTRILFVQMVPQNPMKWRSDDLRCPGMVLLRDRMISRRTRKEICSGFLRAPSPLPL